MRLQTLVVSLLASTGLTSPTRRDVEQAIYTLRLSSPVKSLDGLYITTTTPDANSTTLGVYTAEPSSTTPSIKFYQVQNPATGLSELHTQDTGNTLAVVGSYGLLDFASLDDPAAVTLPEGTTLDWTSFSLEADGTVKYAGEQAQGRWVAFPSTASRGKRGEAEQGWVVKWKDVNAWTTENYMPVNVVYETVKNA